MSHMNYTHNEHIQEIDAIEFSVYGNDEATDYSVINSANNKDPYGINLAELYDGLEPKRNGLVDGRLGTTRIHDNCEFCELDLTPCQGHFGHIMLSSPTFHWGFLDDVKDILTCVCLNCSKLFIYRNEQEMMDILKNKKGKKRFKEIQALCKNVSYCQKPNSGCGVPRLSIKKNIKKSSATIEILAEATINTSSKNDNGEIVENKKKIKDVLTPEICYNILANISDSDCRILGINPEKTRPEDLILKVFPVPPVAIRPSVKADFMTASTMEDGMTQMLSNIVKTNNKIRRERDKEVENATESKFGSYIVNLLQYYIARYMDNESVSLPMSEQKSGGKKLKSVVERLKSKTGRIRGNLMGKRVDFSARSVITSDPNIGIDELGVPVRIAMNLTIPETVTPHNIEKLTKLVRNGRYKYPGANYIIPGRSAVGYGRKIMIDLRYRKDYPIKYGDIVERHLESGDMVLFNRQPSLHKLSMMGHRAHVINDPSYNTFRLNVSVTPSYNADFDGKVTYPLSKFCKLSTERIKSLFLSST